MTVRILQGDVRHRLRELPADHFDCIVTSPPYYGLRDYGCDDQIGLESTLEIYLEVMVEVCRDLRRVLKPSGVFFCNIGDSYAAGGRGGGAEGSKQTTNHGALLGPKKAANGFKPKDLMLVPERLGIALQADGWWVRSRIVWAKPNPMPESATDRPTSAHETIWMLTKSAKYYWDAEAVKEEVSGTTRSQNRIGRKANPGVLSTLRPMGTNVASSSRNMRNVWTIASHPFPDAHFATFPPELPERCIKAGSPQGGHVLDPFAGSGTTGLVADRLGRDCTLIDLNTKYAEMAMNRIKNDCPMFTEVAAL